jgi:UDP:flavonoid glycosyltransferase YjiC (YdhE family)
MAPRLFGEVGVQLMVDGLLACARDFRPDVVLFESRCYAAPPVARVAGALSVLQVVGIVTPEVEVLANDAVTPLWSELGLDTPSYAGAFDGLTMSAWPASLDNTPPEGDLVVHRLRPPAAASPPPEWLGEWIDQQASRPIIYATLGTVFGRNAAVLTAILDGLASDEVAVLMTVGASGDPAALGTLPPHARVERFVPQDTVLPSCRAVISHAGSGTTLGVLAHGLPHVMLPQGADQYINAARCERAGLGKTLEPAVVTPAAVRSALRDVLDERRYLDSARHVQGEMAAGMEPDAAVGLIQETLDAVR